MIKFKLIVNSSSIYLFENAKFLGLLTIKFNYSLTFEKLAVSYSLTSIKAKN